MGTLRWPVLHIPRLDHQLGFDLALSAAPDWYEVRPATLVEMGLFGLRLLLALVQPVSCLFQAHRPIRKRTGSERFAAGSVGSWREPVLALLVVGILSVLGRLSPAVHVPVMARRDSPFGPRDRRSRLPAGARRRACPLRLNDDVAFRFRCNAIIS